MDLVECLIKTGTEDYKCYDILKKLLQNEEIYNKIKKGVDSNKVFGFTDNLWEMIENQNLRAPFGFLDVFKDGANKGYCTVAAKQLSYSFDTCYICGGVLPILAGTDNCKDGSHTWIEKDGYVIDTSLMLIIKDDFAKELGYVEENRYNPNLDSIYRAAKEFTNDDSLKSKIK